jgi:hypothetical protein
VVRPSHFAAVTKVATKEWQQEQSKIAIKKELKQLFEELVAIVPVKHPTIPKDTSILNSHMFLVNKYNTDGKFEKVKARLVAEWSRSRPCSIPKQIIAHCGNSFGLCSVGHGSGETLADCRQG